MINNREITIGDAIKEENIEEILLTRRENGMKLSNYQIDTLDKNGINFMEYASYRELLFRIEEVLNEEYSPELDIISLQIAELLYYNNTNK